MQCLNTYQCDGWDGIAVTIDFSINGQCTVNRLRSQRIQTPYTIKVNNCKLIDLVIRIEQTRAILMSRFSNFLWKFDHPFSNVFIFGNTFLERHVFVAILQAVSKIHVPIYPYLISEARRNCSTLWQAQQLNRDSQETCLQI